MTPIDKITRRTLEHLKEDREQRDSDGWRRVTPELIPCPPIEEVWVAAGLEVPR